MDFEAELLTIINQPMYSNPEMRNTFQGTLTLREALLYGSIDEIQEILRRRHKVKLSAAQNDWEQRCSEILYVCLDRKICNNMSGSKYSVLLHFAIENLYEDFELVFLRCKGFNVNALVEYSHEWYMSLLHIAVCKERTNVVKVLLKFGADVNVQDSSLQTPLFHAVQYARNEIAKMLLEAGACIDVVENDFGLMPINIAFKGHDYDPRFNSNGRKLYHSDLIQILCDYGADLDFQNPNGTISLFYACTNGDLSDVQFLINHGADLLSRDFNGKSAIHHAVCGNNYELIDFLLRRGVDINAKDDENKSCIHELAKTLDSVYFSLVCLEYESSEFISTVWDFDYEAKRSKESADMIEFLVDNGAEVNTLDLNNRSPLMNSVYLNSFETVEQLLELKADVDNSRNSTFYLIDGEFSSSHPEFHPNADFYANRTNAWVLLTAFLAMKERDISKYCEANSRDFEWVHPFFHQCKTEVNEMKRSICENRSLTYLDFLTKDLMEVSLFCRNGEIMTVLESGNHKEEFRLYKFFFERRMERVQQLKNCENTFRRLIIDKCFNKRKLPLVVMDEIISYLRAADLRNFGRALCISKDFPNGNYRFME